ncbi:MAG TPA: hypothetical protein V6C88_08530 [Chroococcidiopsis sp.]
MIKRVILSGLSAIVMAAAIAPTVKAEPVSEVSTGFPQAAADVGMDVTPFNLVFLAYQGFFESEGIPMASGLTNGYRTGSVDAEDLIRVAVQMRRLSPEAASNRGFVRAVENQLRQLTDLGTN